MQKGRKQLDHFELIELISTWQGHLRMCIHTSGSLEHFVSAIQFRSNHSEYGQSSFVCDKKAVFGRAMSSKISNTRPDLQC